MQNESNRIFISDAHFRESTTKVHFYLGLSRSSGNFFNELTGLKIINEQGIVELHLRKKKHSLLKLSEIITRKDKFDAVN